MTGFAMYWQCVGADRVSNNWSMRRNRSKTLRPADTKSLPPQEPQLRIDAGMHTAHIWRIAGHGIVPSARTGAGSPDEIGQTSPGRPWSGVPDGRPARSNRTGSSLASLSPKRTRPASVDTMKCSWTFPRMSACTCSFHRRRLPSAARRPNAGSDAPRAMPSWSVLEG
jgi:hypothetical protein